MPPPANRIGDERSTLSATLGSLEKVAVKEPIKPNEGLVPQTMSQGRKPRTIKTAKIIPHNKNQRLPFGDIVFSTSALITALSILETISKSESPRMTRIMLIISKPQFLQFTSILLQCGILILRTLNDVTGTLNRSCAPALIISIKGA